MIFPCPSCFAGMNPMAMTTIAVTIADHLRPKVKSTFLSSKAMTVVSDKMSTGI